MTRPRDFGSMTAITVTPLHRAVADDLTQAGEYFFPGAKIMDVFGLAYTPEDTRQAIGDLLSMSKWLASLECQLAKFGFREITRSSLRYAFTYTIQSERHSNPPIVVNEVFTLQVPLLALASETASMWVNAFARAPRVDILAVAQGH